MNVRNLTMLSLAVALSVSAGCTPTYVVSRATWDGAYRAPEIPSLPLALAATRDSDGARVYIDARDLRPTELARDQVRVTTHHLSALTAAGLGTWALGTAIATGGALWYGLDCRDLLCAIASGFTMAIGTLVSLVGALLSGVGVLTGVREVSPTRHDRRYIDAAGQLHF